MENTRHPCSCRTGHVIQWERGMRGYIVLIAALLFGVAFAVKLMCSGITLQLMPPALTNAIEGVAHVAAGDEAFQRGEYAKAEEEYLAALKDGDKLGFLTGGRGTRCTSWEWSTQRGASTPRQKRTSKKP